MSVLHYGTDTAAAELDPEIVDILEHAGLLHRVEDRVHGAWQITSHEGLLVAARRSQRSEAGVYLGHDGMRFASAILRRRPRGRVLDVGCGSGISSVAAAVTADHVTATDVIPDAVEACRVTTALNGYSAVVEPALVHDTEWGDLDDADCVLANLPGLPIPDHINYPAGGNGGPTGRDLARRLWTTFASSLGRGERPRELLIRFESTGTRHGSDTHTELLEMFGGDCDVVVEQDSVLPAAVRDRLTAQNAAPFNPHIDPDQLYRRLELHRARLGYTHFYSGSARVCWPGTGVSRRLGGGPPVPPTGTGPTEPHRLAVEALARLPDEYWELAGHTVTESILRNVDRVYEELRSGAPVESIAARLFRTSAQKGSLRHLAAELAVCEIQKLLDVESAV